MKNLVALLACLGCAAAAAAQAPETIGYQGHLTQNGMPMTGTVGLTFRLYTTPDAATPVWSEHHPAVTLQEGSFDVVLGSLTPFRGADPTAPPPSLFFGRPLYLGIEVDGESEMTPRSTLHSVGSSLTLRTPARLRYADQENSGSPLRLDNDGRGQALSANARQYALLGNVTGEAFGTGVWGSTYPGALEPQIGVYGIAHSLSSFGAWGANIAGGVGLHGTSEGGSGIGVLGEAPDLSGETTGVVAIASSPDGTGLRAEGGHFGARIVGGVDGIIVEGPNNAIAASSPLTGIQSTARDVAVWAIDSAQTLGTLGVYSQTYSDAGFGVYARAYSPTGTTNGVYGRTDSPEGRGVTGYATAGTGVNYGVRGFTNSTDGYAMFAHARATSGLNYGLWAQNDSPEGSAVAGIALATSGTPYAVYGRSDAPEGYAGYFDGKVHVNGTLSKAGGSFTIDHPLDPENRTLSHSFVESPDMMNVYNGNVRLDAAGEALVQLPEWFEALNRDFRYQLTAIGGPAPNLHVAQTISGNRFRIAGGSPGQEISWQVTGIRRDAWAEANRIEVEREKPAGQRGSYLHPEARGLPASRGVRRGPTRDEAHRVNLSDLEVEDRIPSRPGAVSGPTLQELHRQMNAVQRLIEEAERAKK